VDPQAETIAACKANLAVAASFLIIGGSYRIVVIIENRGSYRALEVDSIPPPGSLLRRTKIENPGLLDAMNKQEQDRRLTGIIVGSE
jgi:hypothetical protein